MKEGYYIQLGSPFGGKTLDELKTFLNEQGLSYAPNIQHTAIIRDDDDHIAATASLEDAVIKCVAARESARGEGLIASLVGEMRSIAIKSGHNRLFLYTKPNNAAQFAGCGFYPVVRTDTVLFMEDRRTGFADWAANLSRPETNLPRGAVVMNCDPMTLGHMHLIEQAAARCGFLYIFILSEDKGAVPAADRLSIVKRAVAHIKNAQVFEGGAYLISMATFPDYFLKDRGSANTAWCEIDVAVFCRLAEMLKISMRFVGSEPFSSVTAAYNEALKRSLPDKNIELIELERIEKDGTPISASTVRALIHSGEYEAARPLVPDATWEYISREENRAELMRRNL